MLGGSYCYPYRKKKYVYNVCKIHNITYVSLNIHIPDSINVWYTLFFSLNIS